MATFGSDMQSICGLNNLLASSKEAQEDREKTHNVAPVVDGSIVVKSGSEARKEKEIADQATKVKQKAIWDEDEIPSQDAIIDESDSRKAARYEFFYKQTVGTEDTMLGMTVSKCKMSFILYFLVLNR